MTITEAITATYLRAVGKATPPSTTSAKYNRIVGLLDYFQREWAREPGIDWNSLYNPAYSIGAVTATDTFDLDTSTVRKLSSREGDVVRIVWSDGVGYTDYDIVDANKLKDYYAGANKESSFGFICARIGNDLVFNDKFTSSDSQYGGTIYIPAYIYPDAITSDNPDVDEVQVDNPDWLVTRAAAEYCRNDITRRQRYPELLGEANNIMGRMKDDNYGQIDTVNTPWTPFSGIGTSSPWS